MIFRKFFCIFELKSFFYRLLIHEDVKKLWLQLKASIHLESSIQQKGNRNGAFKMFCVFKLKIKFVSFIYSLEKQKSPCLN